jgi:hypothetical protein
VPSLLPACNHGFYVVISRHSALVVKIFRSMPLLLMNAYDNLEPVFYTSILHFQTICIVSVSIKTISMFINISHARLSHANQTYKIIEGQVLC